MRSTRKIEKNSKSKVSPLVEQLKNWTCPYFLCLSLFFLFENKKSALWDRTTEALKSFTVKNHCEQKGIAGYSNLDPLRG